MITPNILRAELKKLIGGSIVNNEIEISENPFQIKIGNVFCEPIRNLIGLPIDYLMHPLYRSEIAAIAGVFAEVRNKEALKYIHIK